MALFKKDYNKPGPGVPKNAIRKKGIARFFEIISRDGGNLIKLNLLVFLCELPSLAMFLFAIIIFFMTGAWPVLFLLIAAILAIPVGAAKTAEAYILTKMLRDDPGFIWHDFKIKFKENFKASVIPGIIYFIILGSQAIGLMNFFLLGQQLGIVLMALFIFSILLVAMMAPYFFAQIAYVDLKSIGIFKNSLLLALGYLPRSFAGAIMNLALIAGQIVMCIYIPFLVLVPIVIGLSIPMLINMMWIWKPLDKTFNIEDTLKKRQEAINIHSEEKEETEEQKDDETEEEKGTEPELT